MRASSRETRAEPSDRRETRGEPNANGEMERRGAATGGTGRGRRATGTPGHSAGGRGSRRSPPGGRATAAASFAASSPSRYCHRRSVISEHSIRVIPSLGAAAGPACGYALVNTALRPEVPPRMSHPRPQRHRARPPRLRRLPALVDALGPARRSARSPWSSWAGSGIGTASAASEEDAVREAQTAACGPITGSMNDRIACAKAPAGEPAVPHRCERPAPPVPPSPHPAVLLRPRGRRLHLAAAGRASTSAGRIRWPGARWSWPGRTTRVPASPVDAFNAVVAIPKGMADAASVIFYVFLVGGAFAVVERTGRAGAAGQLAGAAAGPAGDLGHPDRRLRLRLGRHPDPDAGGADRLRSGAAAADPAARLQRRSPPWR